jgi:hypothetical protein
MGAKAQSYLERRHIMPRPTETSHELEEWPKDYRGPNLDPDGLKLEPQRLAEGVYALRANTPPKDNNGYGDHAFGNDAFPRHTIVVSSADGCSLDETLEAYPISARLHPPADMTPTPDMQALPTNLHRLNVLATYRGFERETNHTAGAARP